MLVLHLERSVYLQHIITHQHYLQNNSKTDAHVDLPTILLLTDMQSPTQFSLIHTTAALALHLCNEACIRDTN